MPPHHHILEVIGSPLILAGALELFLAVILLRENSRKSPVNRSVAAFSFFAAAYSLITGAMYVRASFGYDVTVLARANWISWMMIPAALQFVFYMRDEQSSSARLAGRILYPFWFLVFCVSISTDLIEKGNYALLPFIDRSGPLGKPLRFVALLLILLIMYEIYRLRREVTGIKRAQVNYFAHGVLIFCAGGATLAAILQFFGGFGLEPGLGSYFSLPWVVLTFYAMTRYRLFDMRVIISRMVTIGLLAGIFSLVQIGFFAVLEPVAGHAWTIMISLFCIGLLFFSPRFTKTIQALVQRLVLQRKFDYRRILKESSKAIMTILDLDELLVYLVHSIRTGLGVGNVRLYLRGAGGQYVQHSSAESYEGVETPLHRSVIDRIGKTGQMIIREELAGRLSDEEFGSLNAAMKGSDIDLYMPLFSKGQLQGILALGKKADQEAYDQGDIELLEVLAGHAAIAIENARLYEEARRVQESLRESQERFRNLVETTSDWVWEMDDRGVYTYVSPKIRDILGYEPEEMLGKTFFDFMPKQEARRAADFFVSLTRNKQPFMMYQNTNLHKSGRIVVIETSGVPIFDQTGRFGGYRGIDRDVTRRNELEGRLRYAQKMEAIGRLAAGVAHDFNNINTAIVGYANLLQLKMQDGDPLQEYLGDILAATKRSADLTRSLLSFSRKQEVKPEPRDMNDIIRNIDRLTTGLIRENVERRFLFHQGELVISCDQVQMERVLMNLVANARDAMPDGGHLTIETREVNINEQFMAAHGYGKPGVYALITISDTGIGIDRSVIGRIFEPFFSTKGEGKGTGFGLSIVYDIVKQHSGYINVESVSGQGSSFHVYLPLLNRVNATGPAKGGQNGGMKNGTVLVADNDDEDRKFIKEALEAKGYRVVEAIDGRDAIDKFRQQNEKIGSVILDLIMPDMNGKEAYQAIREKQPDVKVLFMSSYSDDVLQKSMLGSHMNFILKPFSPKELLDRLNALQ